MKTSSTSGLLPWLLPSIQHSLQARRYITSLHKWPILGRAAVNQSGAKQCKNFRVEIVSICRHKNKFYTSSWKFWAITWEMSAQLTRLKISACVVMRWCWNFRQVIATSVVKEFQADIISAWAEFSFMNQINKQIIEYTIVTTIMMSL